MTECDVCIVYCSPCMAWSDWNSETGEAREAKLFSNETLWDPTQGRNLSELCSCDPWVTAQTQTLSLTTSDTMRTALSRLPVWMPAKLSGMRLEKLRLRCSPHCGTQKSKLSGTTRYNLVQPSTSSWINSTARICPCEESTLEKFAGLARCWWQAYFGTRTWSNKNPAKYTRKTNFGTKIRATNG